MTLSLKFCLYSLRRVPVTQQRHNGTGWLLPYGGYPPESPGSGRHGSNADAPRDLLRCCRGYRWWSVPVFSSALRCSAERRGVICEDFFDGLRLDFFLCHDVNICFFFDIVGKNVNRNICKLKRVFYIL